jgi:hypothetical protein
MLLVPERAAAQIMELLDLGRPVRILVTIERDRDGMVHVELATAAPAAPAETPQTGSGSGAMHKAEIAIKWEWLNGGNLESRDLAVVNKLERPIRAALGECFASPDGLALVDVILRTDGRELRVFDAMCGMNAVVDEAVECLRKLESVKAAGLKVTKR